MQPTVLFVDCNRDITETATGGLREMRPSWQWITAGSRREAMTAFKKMSPQAAIVDAHLPDGDGFELLSEMRLISPLLPVVMTSAEAPKNGNGMNGHRCVMIEKPFSLTELFLCLEREIHSACLLSQPLNGKAKKPEPLMREEVTALALRTGVFSLARPFNAVASEI